MGGDVDKPDAHADKSISIRTPAWGVTCGDNSIVTYVNAFQFAPPHGG